MALHFYNADSAQRVRGRGVVIADGGDIFAIFARGIEEGFALFGGDIRKFLSPQVQQSIAEKINA